MGDKWHNLSAVDLGKCIARGEIHPVELTQYFLDRIKTVDADHPVGYWKQRRSSYSPTRRIRQEIFAIT